MIMRVDERQHNHFNDVTIRQQRHKIKIKIKRRSYWSLQDSDWQRKYWLQSFILERKNYWIERAQFEIVQKEISTRCKKTFLQPKNCWSLEYRLTDDIVTVATTSSFKNRLDTWMDRYGY